jgi:hypothetical protein
MRDLGTAAGSFDGKWFAAPGRVLRTDLVPDDRVIAAYRAANEPDKVVDLWRKSAPWFRRGGRRRPSPVALRADR